MTQPSKLNTNKWVWRILLIVLGLAALGMVGFVAWANNPLPAMPEAGQALVSDETVQVTTEPWIIFEPAGGAANAGVIFYPGGRVDPTAYAPPLRKMAEAGYLAVIVPMPLNLAVFAPGAAAEVISAYPEIEHWVIGGHSLGGAMAANFVAKNPGQVDGLFFWAAYPADSDDLSGQPLEVRSIYGSLDGVANLETIGSSSALLPPGTVFELIEGGNHAQFGWYGDQPGDNPAGISREAQQEIAVQSVLEILAELER